MAETHEEIFRASIEIKLPDLAKLEARIKSFERVAVSAARNIRAAFKGLSVDLGDVPGAQGVGQDLKGAADAAKRAGEAAKGASASVDETSASLKRLNSVGIATFDDVSDRIGKVSSELNKATGGASKLSEALRSGDFGALADAALGVPAAIAPITREAFRLRGAMRLATGEGGSAFLALRTAIFDVAPATNRLSKALDILTFRSGRLSKGFNAFQKDLARTAAEGIAYADSTKRAAAFLKDLGKENEVLKTHLGGVDELLRQQSLAWSAASNSALASGKVTRESLARIENSLTRARGQVELFVKAEEAAGKPLSKEMTAAIGQFNTALDSQSQRLRVLKSTAQSASESVDKFGKSEQISTGRISQLTSALRNVLPNIKGVARTGRDASKATGDIGQSARSSSIDFAKLTRALTKANIVAAGIVGVFNAVKGAVGGVTSAVSGMASEILGLSHVKSAISGVFTGFVDLAARVDTLRVTLETVGRTAGIPLDFLNDKIQELRESGITTSGAMRSMTTWITQKLPVQRIDELSRAAQDMAVAFGVNSTDAFNRFTTAIVRGSTFLLKGFGIETASAMFEKFAVTVGKTASQLTLAEKQMAIFSGILKASEPFAGSYESALDSVGKKMGSLARKIEEASLSLGQIFLPVLGNTIDKIGELLAWLQDIFTRFRPQLEQLGTLLIDVANSVFNFFQTKIAPAVEFALSNIEHFVDTARTFAAAISSLFRGDIPAAVEGLQSVFVDMVSGLQVVFGNVISNAFEWGRGFVVNLANGIIDAGSSVLMQAVTWIGDLVSSFFAPGSAPDKGPLSTMDKWGEGWIGTIADSAIGASASAFSGVGVAAAGGFSEGLTETFRNLDLSSLKAIREAISPIRGILQSMADTGEIGEVEVPGGLLEIRELLAQLADGFEETGELSEDMLDAIGDKLGSAGEDMKEFLRLQFELKGAQEELKQIDEEIADAEQAGFVPAALRERKKELEGRIDGIGEELEAQKEILSWQQQSKDLMQQQKDILERIAKSVEGIGRAGVGGQQDQWEAFKKSHEDQLAALERKKELGIITEEEYQKARLQLERQYIDTAIKLGKPLSADRIAAFKELQAQVKSLSGGKGLKGVGKAGNEMWDNFIAGFKGADEGLRKTEGFLRKNMVDATRQVGDQFTETRERVQGTFDAIAKLAKLPIDVKIQAILGPISEAFERLPEGVKDAFDTIANILKSAARTIKTVVLGVVAFVSGLVDSVIGGGGVVELIRATWRTLTTVIQSVIRAIQHVAGAFGAVFGGGGSLQRSTGGFVAFMESAGRIVGGVIDRIAKALATVVKFIGPVIQRVVTLLARVIRGMLEFFGTLVKRLAESEAIGRAMESIGSILRQIWLQLVPIAKVVGVVLGGILAIAVGIVDGLANALGPFANFIADIVELAANIVDVILRPFAAVHDTLVALFTEGPRAALDALLGHTVEWWKSILGIFTSIGNAIKHVFQTALGFLVGFVDGIVGAITGNFGMVIDNLNKVAESFGKLIGALTEKLENPFQAMEEGAENAEAAIESWSETSEDGADVAKDLADRVNKAREEFDRAGGGVLGMAAKVALAGEDIKLFKEAADEANETFLGLSTTHEEYTQRVRKFNDLVEVDAMRITEEYSEAAFDLGKSIEGASSTTDKAAVILQRFGLGSSFISRAIEEATAETEKFARVTERVAQGVEGSQAAMDSATRSYEERAEATRQAADRERGFAQAVIDSVGRATPEIARLLTERSAVENTHQEERKTLLSQHNQEMAALEATGTDVGLAALKEKHANELAELDQRFADEKLKRRTAIAEALLDLNERVLQEKLALAELTGAEAAAIVAQHRTQAEQIAAHFEIPIDAAERMGASAVQALSAATIQGEQFLLSMGITTEQVLVLMDRLATEGYGALDTEAKAAIDNIIVNTVKLQQDSGAAMGDIALTLQGLPLEYQTLILSMLDTKATADDMLLAMQGLDATFAPTVVLDVKESKEAKEFLRRRSPETELEASLRRLKEFTDDNPIEVQVIIQEGTLESIEALMVGLEATAEVAAGTERTLGRTASNISRIFQSLYLRVAGPAGSMTRMIDQIKRKFQSLTSTFSFLGGFVGQIVGMFQGMVGQVIGVLDGMISQIVAVFNRIPAELAPLFNIGGSIYRQMFNAGIRMMNALAAGAASVDTTIIATLTATGTTAPLPDPDPGDGVEPISAPIGTGPTTVIIEGDVVFPGVTDADEASGIVDLLDDLTARGIAFQQVGAP